MFNIRIGIRELLSLLVMSSYGHTIIAARVKIRALHEVSTVRSLHTPGISRTMNVGSILNENGIAKMKAIGAIKERRLTSSSFSV